MGRAYYISRRGHFAFGRSSQPEQQRFRVYVARWAMLEIHVLGRYAGMYR